MVAARRISAIEALPNVTDLRRGVWFIRCFPRENDKACEPNLGGGIH